ncbi:hypothetical protein ACTM7X_04380 [Citrobacter braakii]|uniref:hypothetical protein n=1 Tax=Enterobacteriaceae TaxID=543 RepID=UPI001900502E|nr:MULTISPECIES: hypothetical protein [Enterobacteriaceae]MBJ9201444.1 hypothetical protein [Citrobacter sp. FDAARGOS_156]HCB1520845.1 hypothetical protein [Citrobacter braakii]HCB1527778.1 hypothetical protein [Citrobacter braakii]
MEDIILMYVGLIASSLAAIVGLVTSIRHTRKKVKANEELATEMAKNFSELESINKSIGNLEATIKRIEEDELKLKIAIESLKEMTSEEKEESREMLRAIVKDEVFIKVLLESYKKLDSQSKNEIYLTFAKSTDRGLYRYIKRIASLVLDNLMVKI